MDFSLSEEQSMLQDSVDKFVRDNCDVDRHRQLIKSQQGFSAEFWQQFAELGWLSVPFSEEQGGFGGGAVDVMVMAEALGKGLLREPFLSTVVTGGGFLKHGGSLSQQQLHIGSIIDGSQHWAFAFAELTSAYDLTAVTTVAEEQAGGYLLSGSKLAVLNAQAADYLVVTARTSGQSGERQGVSLFIVDANQAGVSKQLFTAVDGSRAANISFDNVTLGADQLLGQLHHGIDVVERVIDESIIAMGAEAMGAMQALMDATVEYTRTREQFGQPLSKFQALQHRMADMYLKVEEMRSLLYNAAIQVDEGSEQASLACAALKVKTAEAGKYVSQQAIQLHGGIGMTDELIVGHHFKRLLLLAMLYGDEDYYLQRYHHLSQSLAS
ncbi:MAG: alkylation response protein AidB-like acyl-CoA dehydrogenase [Oceanicoccus sp.]|jgi:alkylation response protein AidB-like acyl-CoA dehydrogenase